MYTCRIFAGLCLLLLYIRKSTTSPILPTPPPKNSPKKNELNVTALIDDLLTNSDSRVRPNLYGAPVDIVCDIRVESFGSINEVDMDFALDVYFKQEWTDPRLQFDKNAGVIIIPENFMKGLWVPDIFFPNEKSGYFHNLIMPNKVVKIHPDGSVIYTSRLTLKLGCPMSLIHFPLDYQDCHLQVSTFSYDVDHVTLKWRGENPIYVDTEKLSLPQFQLLEITSGDNCETVVGTNHSCLSATFHLKRQVGYYVLQTYVPSILIVILSWLSFWISKDAVPARITLGVTTVLTMTTQSSRSASIKVSYPKAIDVWYAMCMFMVFGALLEFALVNILSRRDKRDGRKEEMMRKQSLESLSISGVVARQDSKLVQAMKRSVTARGVDNVARVLFPLSFVAFNAVYWWFYTQRKLFFNEKFFS